MAGMTSLTHLDLGVNHLEGDVPDGFSRLTKLQYLDMSLEARSWTGFRSPTLSG